MFVEELPELSEERKLTKVYLSKLECRLEYAIKCDIQAMFGPEQNDELYRIYGEQVERDPQFMRTWVRLYIITNKKHVQKLSFTYFQSINSNLTKWLKDLKNRNKGDVLALYVLSVITGIHCLVHLCDNQYWTSLKEVPGTHLEFMQRCNIHLAYFGNGIFIELKPRTTVNYKLFGIDQPVQIEEQSPAILGTLTCEEDITLDILLDQDKRQTIKRTEHDNTDILTPILPKKVKRNERTTAHTIVKSDKDETEIVIGSMTAINKDNNKQTTTAHDESDSTIIYDYLDQDKRQTIKRIAHDNVDAQTPILPKKVKRKERTITHTLAKPDSDETEFALGSITVIYKDDNNETTTAHDESDSTILYDYQPNINDVEIKNSTISDVETETKSTEIKSTLKSTKIL